MIYDTIVLLTCEGNKMEWVGEILHFLAMCGVWVLKIDKTRTLLQTVRYKCSTQLDKEYFYVQKIFIILNEPQWEVYILQEVHTYVRNIFTYQKYRNIYNTFIDA